MTYLALRSLWMQYNLEEKKNGLGRSKKGANEVTQANLDSDRLMRK